MHSNVFRVEFCWGENASGLNLYLQLQDDAVYIMMTTLIHFFNED